MSRKPERFLLRVVKGGFEPADGFSAQRLRDKGIRVGDTVSARITKPRNPRFHRLAHVLGQLLADNIDSFEGLEAHRVLKRLQWESGIGCEELGVQMPGQDYALVRIPQSLSFADMDEGEFHEVFQGLCRHVSSQYWPDLDEDQVAEMAEVMPA